MPELPEIETLVRQLQQRVSGDAIIDAQCTQPKMINLPLEEYRAKVRDPIRTVQRRAKSAVLLLAHGDIWLHLGLRGEARYVPQGAPPPPAMVSLLLQSGARIALIGVFMGHAHYLSPDEHQRRWTQFGVEPLSPEFTPDTLGSLLRARSELDLKGLLMDQTVIAGIGNAYSDEVLFTARLHPARPAGTLSDAERASLHESVLMVLEEAVRQGGETGYIDLFGNHGRYETRIHGRKECPACHSPVKIVKFRGRTAYYCPVCQAA